jgi:hypothetical protein
MISSVREYRLALSSSMRLEVFGYSFVVIVLALVFSAVFAWTVLDDKDLPVWLIVIGVPAMLVTALMIALRSWRIPKEIRVCEDGRIQFRGWLRIFEVAISEIRSIRPTGQFGWLKIKTSRGDLKILSHFDGFHQFILDLRRRNPRIELRGW